MGIYLLEGYKCFNYSPALFHFIKKKFLEEIGNLKFFLNIFYSSTKPIKSFTWYQNRISHTMCILTLRICHHEIWKFLIINISFIFLNNENKIKKGCFILKMKHEIVIVIFFAYNLKKSVKVV